jgi:hypothetical protein
LLLFAIIWAAFLSLMFQPVLLDRFDYPKPSYQNVTRDMAPSVCTTEVEGWSLLQLAGLAMIAQNPKDEAVRTGLETVFGPSANITYEIFPGEVISAVVVHADWSDSPVLAFQGLALKHQLCILFENIVAFWFPMAMDIIIPCFELVNDIFLVDLLNPLVGIAERLFVGLPPMSDPAMQFGNDLGEKIKEEGNGVPIFVGHMPGGLLAKEVGLAVDGYSVAFESIKYSDSLMQLISGNSDESWNQFNIWSSPSIFAMVEEEITTNIKLPEANSMFKPPTPYSTFCLLAAACVSDDSFDGLCFDESLDIPYDDYYELWLRTRYRH